MVDTWLRYSRPESSKKCGNVVFIVSLSCQHGKRIDSAVRQVFWVNEVVIVWRRYVFIFAILKMTKIASILRAGKRAHTYENCGQFYPTVGYPCMISMSVAIGGFFLYPLRRPNDFFFWISGSYFANFSSLLTTLIFFGARGGGNEICMNENNIVEVRVCIPNIRKF